MNLTAALFKLNNAANLALFIWYGINVTDPLTFEDYWCIVEQLACEGK